MKKQVNPFLNFKPLSVSPTRRQLLLSGLALVLLGSKSQTAQAETGGMLRKQHAKTAPKPGGSKSW